MIPPEDPAHQLLAGNEFLLLRAQPLGLSTGGAVLVIPPGADHFGVVLFCQRQHGLKSIRLQPVVAVHKGKIIPGRHIDPRVPGVAEAAVFLVDHPDAAVLLGKFIADGPAAVRGAVIHQNDLQVGIGLIPNGFHAFGQVILHLVDGHDHTEQALHAFLPSSAIWR